MLGLQASRLWLGVFSRQQVIGWHPAYSAGEHLGIAFNWGLWFMGGPLTVYVVRRPWSPFAGETAGAIVELKLRPFSTIPVQLLERQLIKGFSAAKA
ncbi:MAG: ECF transporter S component [Candidatus Caldarchaeum sp.]|jgi:ABC-type thiamin/hydroxymethylpyrimidine transport system permease subunit